MTRLRVAIDARRLQDEPLGGVGRSLAGLVDLLAAEVDIVLLTDARRPPIDTTIAQFALAPPLCAPELAWIQWNVPRWLRGFRGVFHGTFNQLPWRSPVPAVVTIHDLSFEVHPEGMGRAKRRAFQLQARRAARVATRVVAPSQFTRRELIEQYHLSPERVVVTPWGTEARFGPQQAMALGPTASPARRRRALRGGDGRCTPPRARRRGCGVALRARGHRHRPRRRRP